MQTATSLWKRPVFVNIIQQLYDDATSYVIYNGKLTVVFSIQAVFIAGCLLSTIVFLMIIHCIGCEMTKYEKAENW